MTEEVVESETFIDTTLKTIEPTMITIFDFVINLMNNNDFAAGAVFVTQFKTWYLTQFAGAAEQILTIAGLVLYYYVLISVNTVWQLVPARFQLLVMGLDEFEPNSYDD